MKKCGSLKGCIPKIFFAFILASFLLMAIEPAVSSAKNEEPSEQARGNKEILKGIYLLYDEQFDDAEEIFRKVIAKSAEKPDGYFYLAMVTWSRLASGFWSPEIVEQFRKRIDRTIQVARRRIENNAPNSDSYDYFFLGGALGFKGRFRLMEGKWLASFLLANDAVEALKTCLKIDSSNKDVLLGLGTFDYYTAKLSGVLKFLSYLLIHWGDKEEGLRKLHQVAREGLYSATEAKSLLLHIYLFAEEDFSKALQLAAELAAKYKRNPRYEFFKGVCYIRMNMDLQYRDMVSLFRRRALDAPLSDTGSFWDKRALYLEIVRDLYDSSYPEARQKIRMILNQARPESDPAMIAWPLIKMGMSYDLEGNREQAIKYYCQVLNMENGSGAQFLAKKLIENPPKKNDPFIGY